MRVVEADLGCEWSSWRSPLLQPVIGSVSVAAEEREKGEEGEGDDGPW
jgi:hypothetical protein